MSWLDTLKSLNMQVDEAGNCQLAEPQSGTTTVTPLTHLGIFDVIGPEAENSCTVSSPAISQRLLQVRVCLVLTVILKAAWSA